MLSARGHLCSISQPVFEFRPHLVDVSDQAHATVRSTLRNRQMNHPGEKITRVSGSKDNGGAGGIEGRKTI